MQYTYTSDEAFNTTRSTFDDESNKAGAELLMWISVELEVFSDPSATKKSGGMRMNVEECCSK
jgi:hypothetical protein